MRSMETNAGTVPVRLTISRIDTDDLHCLLAFMGNLPRGRRIKKAYIDVWPLCEDPSVASTTSSSPDFGVGSIYMAGLTKTIMLRGTLWGMGMLRLLAPVLHSYRRVRIILQPWERNADKWSWTGRVSDEEDFNRIDFELHLATDDSGGKWRDIQKIPADQPLSLSWLSQLARYLLHLTGPLARHTIALVYHAGQS